MPKKIPEVEVIKHERITISIWLVPIIALLISLWLAYQYFSQLGPQITIEFSSSAGLKAKQSQVKFHDVPIGTVKKISLKEGGNGVIVTVRMNKDAEQFLNKDAKFWIVKPKIDKTGITGLETLVSGSYIQLYGTTKGNFRKHFVGLEEPFLDEKNIKGKYFTLNAPNSYDLEQGSLVYCRNIEVGEIKHVKLSSDGSFVEFIIFVKEPYYKFINGQTQFWYMSNFKIDISKSRLDMSLASSNQIIYGGIAFSTPNKQINQYPLKKEQHFTLFSSHGDAQAKRIGYNRDDMHTYQMRFDHPLGKLAIDAPIMFYDFQIGHVINIESNYNPNKGIIVSKILTDIDISVFARDKNNTILHLNEALEKGLIAQLTKSNPLLDSLHIELIYDKNQTSYSISKAQPYDIFPTKDVIFDDPLKRINALLDSATKLLDNNDQPIQNVFKNLNKTIKSINALVSTKEIKRLPKQLDNSLLEFEATLKKVQNLINDKSTMGDDISETMKELGKASKALERVLQKIDQKPNSLIFGD